MVGIPPIPSELKTLPLDDAKEVCSVVSYCTVLVYFSGFCSMKEEKQKVLHDYFPLFYDDYKQLEAYKKDTFQNHFADARLRAKQVIKKMLGYKKAPVK